MAPKRGLNPMALIHVPRPQNAADPNRPVSSLLRAQMEHLYEAEKRLPHQYKSQIYINAIQTEGEAAEYIRKVTEAIHRAHVDAAHAHRAPKRGKRGGGLAIAAVADDATPESGPKSKSANKSSGKGRRKES
jgi:hypothetical protein